MLRPIDWTTPRSVLEALIRHEAVHAIDGFDDLQNRIATPDRRCYGFFHPHAPDEPLIFVEVALTREIPAAIGPILDRHRRPIAPETATTAVFYSISNTQRGLAGIGLGHFLIRQVVDDLKRHLPGLATFVTLSPAPRFAEWLAAARRAGNSGLPAGTVAALSPLDRDGWWRDATTAAAIGAPLLGAAAYYFLAARDDRGRVVDPVARFHLANGARLERLNPLADTTAKGLEQAHGLMVNYRYDPETIEANHAAFVEGGTVVAAPEVRALAGGAAREGTAG